MSDIAHPACFVHFADHRASCCAVLVLYCHCCCVYDNPRDVRERQTPMRGLLFHDLSEVEPDVETAHLHNGLRIAHETKDAYHLVVAY